MKIRFALTILTALWFHPRAFGDEGEVASIRTDLLIVGGTESGWAAAIQAARMGVPSITIVHDGRWLGGQFTEQALACVDENKGVGKVGWGVDWHPMKRSFHRSGLFAELMDEIESVNTARYGQPMPGRPYHGPSTFRPVEAEAVFRKLLQPLVDSGQVRLIWDRYPVAADVTSENDLPRLNGLSFATTDTHQVDLHVTAKLTIDASDWGEAIQVSGTDFECGVDPRSRYGEPSAPEDLSQNPPSETNPITWAMIVQRQGDGKPRPIKRPPRYDDRNFVRTSEISLQEMRDLAWDRPVKLGSIIAWPPRGKQLDRQLSIYNVRRLVEGATSRQGQTIVLLNYMLGQDYPLERLPQHVVDELEATEPGASEKNIVRMTRPQREIIFKDARRHSLALLHHLQTFVHDRAPDTANSFRHFVLSDEFGTTDRLPPKPYIRESLRLKAMYMMREQDGRNVDGETKKAARERFAQVMYPDGVLCWQFHYDFHRTGRAYLQREGTSGPWIDFEKPGRHTHHISDRSVFPLRSLIPQRMDGLIGAQKNVGYSSIVCAAIRLHDQCVAIGQAAGAAAAISLRRGIAPRQIPYDRELLEQVRHGLCGTSGGTPLLLWPFRDLSTRHDAFVAVNRLAACGIVTADAYDVDFRPDTAADRTWQEQTLQRAGNQLIGELEMQTTDGVTRGEFCRQLWDRVQQRRLRPFPRQDDDADGDGIKDLDDPTLFTAGPVVRWSVLPPGKDEDGLPNQLPPGWAGEDQQVRHFDFSPPGSPTSEGFLSDHGKQFDPQRGYGWNSAMSANSRKRGVCEEAYRDTFLFTRDQAQWNCELPAGTYHVTVCVGDAGHDQPGQRLFVEGLPMIDNVTTAAGRFHETSAIIQLTDGKLTVSLGPQQPGHNTCLNWLRIVAR